MSNNRRNRQNQAQSKSTETEGTNEQVVETGLQEGAGAQGSEQTGETGAPKIATTSGETKPEAKPMPSFASDKAPESDVQRVKLIGELFGEYALANTSRQTDIAKATQATRGLCTGLQLLGNLNASDTKKCLARLQELIKAEGSDAFAEGVVFRYVAAVKEQRLMVDMINLAKRYSKLGDRVTQVVDVKATAEHYKAAVVQNAIVDFYR